MPPVRGPGGATGEEQLVLTPDSNREGPPMIIPGNGPRGGEGGVTGHLARAHPHAPPDSNRDRDRDRDGDRDRDRGRDRDRVRFDRMASRRLGKIVPAVPRAEPPRSNRRSLRLRPPCAAREEILFARFPREQDFQPRGMLAQISVGPGAARRQPAPVSHLRAHAHTHMRIRTTTHAPTRAHALMHIRA